MSPLGADNEDEENEGEDGEQKQNGDNNTDDKQPESNDGDKVSITMHKARINEHILKILKTCCGLCRPFTLDWG